MHNYVHIPKDEREKLDSKAKKCVFLGYGDTTKGFRLYDPEKRRVIFSRDVVFHETETEKTESSSDSISTNFDSIDSDKLIIENHEGQEVPSQEIDEASQPPGNLNQ